MKFMKVKIFIVYTVRVYSNCNVSEGNVRLFSMDECKIGFCMLNFNIKRSTKNVGFIKAA